MSNCCDNCKWSRSARKLSSYPSSNYREKGFYEILECHRMPPSIIATDGESRRGEFPVVYTHNWCGEWKRGV